MKRIKPHYRVPYGAFTGRTWEDVIKETVPLTCPSAFPDRGLNAHYVKGTLKYYYVYIMLNGRIFYTRVPKDLSEYITKYCESVHFVP